MLFGGPARKRDARLKQCFLGVERSWDDDLADLDRCATPWLCEHLRKQRAAFATRGRTIHNEHVRIERFELVSGGGPDDQDCLVRITSTARHWVTGVAMGELETGTPSGERVSRYWRFVRDPTHEWLVDEIGVEAPPGWPATTRPQPV